MGAPDLEKLFPDKKNKLSADLVEVEQNCPSISQEFDQPHLLTEVLHHLAALQGLLEPQQRVGLVPGVPGLVEDEVVQLQTELRHQLRALVLPGRGDLLGQPDCSGLQGNITKQRGEK